MKKVSLVLVILAAFLYACSSDSGTPTDPGNNNGGSGGGVGGGGSTTTTADTILVSGLSFTPSTLTVAAGRTIVFVQQDNVTHTVTPDGHSAWSRVSRSTPGEVMRITISAAGTYPYFCEPHRSSGMTGTITVQ